MKISVQFFTEIEKNLKIHMGTQKNQDSQTILSNESITR